MKVNSFIHPSRTFLPSSGVGRHVNNLLLTLNREEEIELSLLYAKEWLLQDGKLPNNAPLRNIPFTTFPLKERLIERSWKAFNWPKMDKFINGDWMFSPVETRFPVRKKKIAITIHDLQAFEPDLPWTNTLEHKKFAKRWGLWVQKAAEQSDLVFTVSEFSRKRLIELLNLDGEKVKISGNAIDPIFHKQLGEIESKSPTFPYVAVIGGLRPKKGGFEILKLAKRIKNEWPEMKLVIWGENDEKLVRQAKEIGNIISLNMISDQEMIAWLKGAHASIFLSWYEGFGIPVLEAMACGVPIISSNKASLPEVSGYGGLITEPDDTNKILEILIDLKSSAYRKSVIEYGYENIKRYDWKFCAANVFRALQEF